MIWFFFSYRQIGIGSIWVLNLVPNILLLQSRSILDQSGSFIAVHFFRALRNATLLPLPLLCYALWCVCVLLMINCSRFCAFWSCAIFSVLVFGKFLEKNTRITTEIYYYCYCYYLLQWSFHPVAVVITPVQTKQIEINIHKRNNTRNTVQAIQNTVNRSTHITKTPTQLSKHPHIHTPTHYKTPTYIHPHITKQVKTTTVQDTHYMK